MIGHATTDYVPPTRVIVRLTSNVTRVDGGCLVSNYSKNAAGYSQIGWQEGGRRVTWLGHRVAYAASYGAIPYHMTVDHTCRNRACVNPNHLRLLSHEANCRDNAQVHRTHCPHGHEYDAANTIFTARGHRKCRTCDLQRKREKHHEASTPA